jgi:hypothetical protein
MKLKIAFLLTFFFLFVSQSFALDTKLDVGGYYKNLFTTSRSQVTREDLFADTQRLRLEFRYNPSPWEYFISFDNEAIVNDFENTPDFDFIRSKNQAFNTSLDLDKTSVDDDHLYLRHGLYRAYVKYNGDNLHMVLGKQAIDWGKMRFYSPLDLFNPPGPIDIEYEERIGVDAINLNLTNQNFAGLNLIIAPSDDPDINQYGLKLYNKVGTYDLSLIAAQIRKDTVVGFSFDGYLKDAGLRGEVSHTIRDNDDAFSRAAIGLDYNFGKKIYVLIEQFYNGGHDSHNASTIGNSYQNFRDLLSFKKNLASLFIKYTITPLLEFRNAVIYDEDGRSVVENPELKYNFSPNTDISIGAQLYEGSNDSEFGTYQHLYYLEFQWFF